MRFHNTLTGELDDFSPINDDVVTLYTCGPTVYDYPHIGNWASFLYWDILVRTLLANGYSVKRVMNITDVGHLASDADEGEDKLEKGAKRENKTAWEVAEFYAEDFMNGVEKLGLIMPEHITKATDYINQQLNLARKLKELGYTYQTTDGIYFDTSKFASYADFAHLDLEAQKAGARVQQNNEKRQPWDFAIWKFTPTGQKRDMEWETPADMLDLPQDPGKPIMGFPGWHLECSAMAMDILGETIDIHTGGIDHIPVHHTNEIAQSEAVTGKRFANYWLHNNHLKIDGGKISKSLGNGYTLNDLEDRGFTPMDLRMFVLQSQFVNEGNFTFDNLQSAHNRLANWRNYAALRHQTHDRLNNDCDKNDSENYISLLATSGAVKEALNDNLNTPLALSIVDEAFDRLDNQPLQNIHRHGLMELLNTVDELLGLQLVDGTPDITDNQKRLILERERVREAKDWTKSDVLRDELLAEGVSVKDTKFGAVWSYA